MDFDMAEAIAAYYRQLELDMWWAAMARVEADTVDQIDNLEGLS